MENEWVPMSVTLEEESGYREGWIHTPTKTWLAKHRVVPGYRLRGGALEDIKFLSDLDMCCASDIEAYDEALKMVKTIVEANYRRGKEPLSNIPTFSDPKPYTRDEVFCAYIEHVYKEAKAFLTQNH